MAFDTVRPGQQAIARSLTQIFDAWQGVAGRGQPLSLTALNSPSWALTVRNLNTASGGHHARFLSSTGASLFEITDAGVELSQVSLNGPLGFDPGTLEAPGLYVAGDSNTGLYAPALDQISIVVNGVARLTANTSGVEIAGSLSFTTGALTLPQIATPSAPASGTSIYSKSGGGIYIRAASGSEVALIDESSAQSLSNKTLVSPIFSGSLLLPDGTVGAPGLGFSSGTDNGLRYISADKWAAVVGGEDWLRLRNGGLLPEIKIGNVDYLAAVTNAYAIPVHVQIQTTDPNDLIVGIHSEITNNATAAVNNPTPDGAAITAVFYQSEATAIGAFRALEVHGVRSRPAAGAGANDSAMAAEIGIHTAASGNAGFGTGTTVPKTMGIWLSSYADAVMASQGETAVAADVGLYISGPPGGGGGGGGFRFPMLVHDTSNVVVFRLDSQGKILAGAAGNQAEPTYSFVGDPDNGAFWGGTNVYAIATGGSERLRIDSSGDLLLGTTSGTAGTRLKVVGGITSTPGLTNSGALIESANITAALTGDQNNWAPTGVATARTIEVTTDATRTVTGITGGATGRMLRIANRGGNTLVLAHNSGSSSVGNKINTHTGADYSVTSGKTVDLLYMSTGVWLIVAVT